MDEFRAFQATVTAQRLKLRKIRDILKAEVYAEAERETEKEKKNFKSGRFQRANYRKKGIIFRNLLSSISNNASQGHLFLQIQIRSSQQSTISIRFRLGNR